MTKQNKLIVGAVVVLAVYYLYDRNKKMKTVADLKAGAERGGYAMPLKPIDEKKSFFNSVDYGKLKLL